MANILTTLINRQTEKYGDRAAVYHRLVNGQWLPYSWKQLAEMRNKTACAMEIFGVREADKIAVFSANDAFILVTDFAAFANRATTVSIYSTSSEQQVEYILRDSQAEIIFVGNQEQYAIARNVATRYTKLRQIVTYTNVVLDTADKTTMTFQKFMELGENATPNCLAEVARRTAEAGADDIATLLYTSGTTGDPKGAILPHSCFNEALARHHERLTSLTDNDTSMSFLPLSHIFEKAWTYFALDCGIRVYINNNPREIQTALREVHPTCMCSVPRFWEKAYGVIQDKIGKMNTVLHALCMRGLKVGRRRNLDYVCHGLKVPTLLEREYQFYDKLIFSKVKKIMGVEQGNIFPTAGAPLSPEITAFFRSIGVPIVIGYGLSESTATVSCFPYVNYKIGTIGTTINGLDVKIGENNEILLKGPTIMRGYYNKPEATAAAFTADGYFRTGDAGHFDADGNLVLTERIKDLFKTSNGKYIAPQQLETRLGQDKYIEQVAVIGDNRKFVTAIIVPAIEAIKDYANRKKIQYKNLEELVSNPHIRELIAQRIEALQEGLASFEKIKKFTLLSKQFTMEAGELTNTLKIRRPIINLHYASQIEAMYA